MQMQCHGPLDNNATLTHSPQRCAANTIDSTIFYIAYHIVRSHTSDTKFSTDYVGAMRNAAKNKSNTHVKPRQALPIAPQSIVKGVESVAVCVLVHFFYHLSFLFLQRVLLFFSFHLCRFFFNSFVRRSSPSRLE